MKKILSIIVLSLCTVLVHSQYIIKNQYTDKTTNTIVTEIENVNDEVITLKNVCVLFCSSPAEEEKAIEAINNLLSKSKHKNTIFYVVDLTKETDLSASSTVCYILCNIQERKMMLEADLYIFSHRDYTSSYIELKKKNDKMAQELSPDNNYKGVLIPIRTIMSTKDFKAKVKNIMNPNRY